MVVRRSVWVLGVGGAYTRESAHVTRDFLHSETSTQCTYASDWWVIPRHRRRRSGVDLRYVGYTSSIPLSRIRLPIS